MAAPPTGLEWWKDLASIAQSIATIAAGAVGGVWAYWRFGLKQERYPHLETTIDIQFLGTLGDDWIAELVTQVENKGSAQHKMYRLRFHLWSLHNGDSLPRQSKRSAQLKFPHLVKSSTFLEDFEYFAVDGGVKAKYTYVTRLPKDTAFVHFHVWFDYGDKRKFSHSTRRTIKVPPDSGC